jgi:hypothetical protein
MVVSGASPVCAGIYHFIIVPMIFAASGIGLTATVLIAHQCSLRRRDWRSAEKQRPSGR